MVTFNYFNIDDTNDNVNQYSVSMNLEKLKQIKDAIIMNCDMLFNKKYKNKSLVKEESFEHSRLIEVINLLLKGDITIIEEIQKDDFCRKLEDGCNIELEEEAIRKKINDLINKGLYEEIDIMVSEEIERLKSIKKEIFMLEVFYLKLIKDSVKIELLKSVSLEEFEIFYDFIDSSKVSNSLKKVLKANGK